ncbi:aldose 1-epimerase [Agrilus planipennis]|uniref:Aldose 1-epimerase n=1 Tax=Agrilus planipennis TaxID=224129 RepID=A0A7F5RF75_AGRPL|nr:aldose 1-epimerase [Agrilus planipennis]
MGIFENSTVKLEQDDFGTFKDPQTGVSQTIRRFTWKNGNGVSIQVINYGVTITAINLPDKNGKVDDITLGYDSLEGYLQPNNRYFGATVGRVANRIGNSTFTLNGNVYQLAANNGPNSLHGGLRGFNKVVWDYYVKGTKVVFSYASSDGEEGYPGNVVTNVTFQLSDENELVIDYKASTTKPTLVNLTNHSYFNLAGNGSGANGLLEHVVTINADRYTETDGGIPTGKLIPVANTVFDLQIPRKLKDVINNVPNALGFDNNFCVYKGTRQSLGFVSRVEHPQSGRVLETYSDQPGVQFYTGNAIPEHTGKGGNKYGKHSAFCLETQIWPDAIHHDNFPNVVLNPGDQYRHVCVYKFLVKA